MSYSDIDVYLKGFGVDVNKEGPDSYNSKWIYTKHLLSDAPAETIIRIADELELDHPYVVAYQRVNESRFWEPGHFRLFLSHLSAFRKVTGALQRKLRPYGISAFVAHVDIEPTKEWQSEIEAALFSMDALAAVLTAGFKESNWTDQEVGVAIGRGVLVVPIIRDMDPYGPIGKYQGLNARGMTVSQVAQGVFDILVDSPKTHSKMLTALVDTAVYADSTAAALKKLDILGGLDDIPSAHLQRFRDGALASQIYAEGSELWVAADKFLSKHGQPGMARPKSGPSPFDVEDDALPF